jgi:hypothetical protein
MSDYIVALPVSSQKSNCNIKQFFFEFFWLLTNFIQTAIAYDNRRIVVKSMASLSHSVTFHSNDFDVVLTCKNTFKLIILAVWIFPGRWTSGSHSRDLSFKWTCVQWRRKTAAQLQTTKPFPTDNKELPICAQTLIEINNVQCFRKCLRKFKTAFEFTVVSKEQVSIQLVTVLWWAKEQRRFLTSTLNCGIQFLWFSTKRHTMLVCGFLRFNLYLKLLEL